MPHHQPHATDRHDDQLQPLVPVDQARHRPRTVDPAADDVGGVVDERVDTAEDVTSEETKSIYDKGVTIQPPS